MRIRNPNPLVLCVSLSALIHGFFFAAEGPRPLRPDKKHSIPVSIVPAPPESMPVSPAAPTPQAVPLPQTPPPVQETTPAPETERPASTVTENFSGLQAEPTGYASVSASFVRPDLREAAINRYAMTIRGLIDRRKEYPYQARRQDQEGSVQLRFTLSRQGALSGEPVLEKQSRYRLLNESAIAAIKNAAPFPPFPEEIMEEEMSFQVVVSFSL